MKLSEYFSRNIFVKTAEVGPPKGVNIHPVIEEARRLKNLVHALNVTDMQSSVMRLGSLAVSHILKSNGIEPVYQLTCRDRNRLALQSDLLSAYVLGVENVLIITGDHPSLGDHPDAMPVFDLDSVQLLSIARQLCEGQDLSGATLDGTPDFCLGAVVNPGSKYLDIELLKMEKKIRAGAEFFQTQAVFEIDTFQKFMREVEKFGVPVMVGVVVLKSAKMARFMNEHVAGVYVPESIIKKFEEAKDKKAREELAVKIASSFIKEAKEICQGVHIMALGWEHLIESILKESGLA